MSEEKLYAGFWIRFFAGFLDIIFLLPLIGLVLFFSGAHEYYSMMIGNSFNSYFISSNFSNFFIVDIITYGISIAYVAYFLTSKKQATIGKRLMGIYVGNPDGSKLSTPKALARALASILTATTAGLGFLVVIFTKEKISLHDFICNTRVFYGRKNGN